MTPLSQMSIGEFISSARDVTFIVGTVILGWKARAKVQPLLEFFDRANKFFEMGEKHMRTVENGMDILLSNHLHHIQQDLGHISGREPRKDSQDSEV